MEKEMLTSLLKKYVTESLAESERKELAVLIARKQNKELITGALENLLQQQTAEIELEDKHYMSLLNAILRAETITAEEGESSIVGKASLLRKMGGKMKWWR